MESHPVWVRGLKPKSLLRWDLIKASHPVWVRGLKLCLSFAVALASLVAPCMGAWIETSDTVQLSLIYEQSHPVWVRGLKQ